MSQILTPGYLRWDGSKFVLDNDVEVVGPAGSAGPTGNVGPAGPPGPNGTASGDLSGTFPGPIAVVGLTGNSGVVAFGISVPNPTITQTATGGTTGQTMTLKSQNATVFGGNLVLQSGTGTTAGIIQFITGNTSVGQFDSTGRLRIGPNASGTFNIFTNLPIPGATTYLFSNNSSGRNISGTYSGAINDFVSTESLNYSAGASSTTGVRLIASGASGPVGTWQSQGVLDQVGSATSALVFTATSGSSGSTGTTGRIFQSGAWTLGDLTTSSSFAQAGLTGPVLNFAPVGGTLTTTSGQALIYATSFGPSNFGTLNLQGNAAINQTVGTTVNTTANSTKFITLLGRRVKLATTTTSPYNVGATDEVVSIGTITTGTLTTTIAAGSNGAALPQGTINVGSTTGFPASGAILVVSSQGAQLITYTSTASTQFLGCSGGTGNLSTGGLVTALFTVNLPSAPTAGDIYTIKDANGSAGQNNIAIVGAGGISIDGSSPGILVSQNYTNVSVVYNGTTWISTVTNNLASNTGYSSVVNVVSGGTANVIGQDQLLLCDPTSGTCTVQAPATPLINMRFTVKDATAKAGVNPIVVQGNGRTLENPLNPGTYASPINITTASLSATWAFDPTRNRYTLV